MTLKLNGWQRLWVVLSILYLLAVIFVASLMWPNSSQEQLEVVLDSLLVWVLPVGALYILGLSVGWIIRGFK